MKKNLILALALALAAALPAAARQPQRGYRGFAEWSSSVRSEKFGSWDTEGKVGTLRETLFHTGFTTSHGYQINPMFFVGAGLGMERDKYDSWVAPVFLQGRADFEWGRLTPFADLRLGANCSQGAGIYFSPSVGYRFNWGRKTGLNLGAGLSLYGYSAHSYDLNLTDEGEWDYTYLGRRHGVKPCFSFRLGVDF